MVKKTGWFVFFVLLSVSCLDEPDCFRLNNNIIGITFKKYTDGTASTTVFTTIKADERDTVFTQASNKVYLPLNYFQQHTLFLFQREGVTDTLEVLYKAQAQFVSSDCGVRYVLSDLDIGYHSFDSVRLITRVPKSTSTGNHIELFLE
jgi:hypothetical protein